MKTRLFSLCGWLLFVQAVPTHGDALPDAGRFEIVERGPDHRVVSRVFPEGRVSSYVEIATGMHYLNDQGGWSESRSLIEPFPPNGAVARYGPMRVIFPANARTEGGLDVSADGKRWRSHLIGIAYAEADSGRAVLVAELTDSIGQLAGDNEIWYPNALVGEMRADIQYVYTIAGLEQNIVIRESVDPRAYGLNPATVRVQVLTEWVEAPEPTKQLMFLKRTTDPVVRAQMVDPDLVEEQLQFGPVIMPGGAAFPIGSEFDSVPTGKTWETRDGRRLLVEQADYSDLKPYLERLPQAAAANKNQKELMAKVQPGARLALPARPPPQARVQGKIERRQVAALKSRGQGFLWDYQLLNANTNDFTFRGDTTYHVTSPVTLTGTTVFEGGTVIKGTNGAGGRITMTGPVSCRSGPYRPFICTGKDDDTVGEQISGSTGAPGTNIYGIYLSLSSNTNAIELHDLRIRNAFYGIQLFSGTDLTLRHAQIGKSYVALRTLGMARMRNALIHDSEFGIVNGSATNNFHENVTFHRLNNLRNGSASTTLTNCLIVAVTNGVNFTGSNNQTNINDSGVFQTLASGSRYLANNSPYRDAGTTNIDATLLADLRQMTTFPPIWLTNDFTSDTVLSPQAQRDTDTPDLGYHYSPLEFYFSGLTIKSNATLLVTNGAAIGIDFSAASFGLKLDSGGTLISEGTPLNLNRFVRTHSVQETTSAAAGSNGVPTVADTLPCSTTLSAQFRFTDLPMFAGNYYHFKQTTSNGALASLVFRDSQIRGGYLSLSPSNASQTIAWTNTLFERVGTDISPSAAMTLNSWNNLFYEGSLNLQPMTNSSWTFKDNLMDGSSITQNNITITHDYNGYRTNSNRLTPNAGNDVVTNVVYETGQLGRWYLPASSPFLDLGSRNATNAGLYHFTSVTNNIKETNSVVNIGLHYIALDANGQPYDTDGEGLFDYLEDINGNGTTEPGESNFTLSDTDGDGVNDYVEYLQGRNRRTGANADTNGVVNLKVYTPLK